MADPMLYINGIQLWEGSRTFNRTRFFQADNWRAIDGTFHQDRSTTAKSTFRIGWNYIPGTESGYIARDDLKGYFVAGNTLTLRVYESDTSYTDYSVIITEYQESIVFRAGGRWVWALNITLEEV